MQPIKLITALGNNETRYNNTRHNVGFFWLDSLCAKLQLNWHKSHHGNGSIAKWQHNNESIVLFKPGLLMNINGKPIIECAKYHHIDPQQILIVYDELDLAVGQIKLKTDGGHGGHNGVRDFIQHGNQNHFYRLRIGIGRPQYEEVSHYVLGKIPNEDKSIINKGVELSIDKLNLLINDNEHQYHQELAAWSKSNQIKE